MSVHDIVLLFVGVLVGGMNSIAGGGMLIGFPVLIAFGLSPLAANITSNLVIMPGSMGSVYGYRKYLRKVPRRYLMLLIPCVIGAAIGALILRDTSSRRFEQIVPALVGLAVILFAFQPLLHLHLNRHIRGKRRGRGPLLMIAAALLPAAIYGGYFGAGFGFVMLAFLGFTDLHEIHTMTGLKNIATFGISLTSLACLYSTGLVNWRFGFIMGAGGVVGAYAGARFAQRTSSRALRTIVVIIGIVTAGYLAFRSY